MKPRPFIVTVTGSREGVDQDSVWNALDGVARAAASEGFPSLTVRHGACPKGADRHADDWVPARAAKGWPVAVDRRPADWTAPCLPECDHGRRVIRHGRAICAAAGIYRNQEMVDATPTADLLVAFLAPCVLRACDRKEPHSSHGADHCFEAAKAAGLPTLPIYFPTNSSEKGDR